MGKHVYCEKPLAMTQGELDSIKNILSKPDNPMLMVGFNRRFAPFSKIIKEELNNHNEPMVINYRINAGLFTGESLVERPGNWRRQDYR